MNKEFLNAAIALLDSGDNAGCDGLVCVGETEFHALRKLVHELTGNWHGSVDESDDEQHPSRIQTMYQHRYEVTKCPSCGNDLTKKSGVTIEGSCDGFRNTLVPSRLEADGTLVDVFGIVEHGLHSNTLCGSCGQSLDDDQVID